MPLDKTCGEENAVGRDLPAKLDPLPRGQPQEIGGAPNDIVFNFIHFSVGIYNLPHHLNDLAASFVVHKLIELAGEVVKIDGGPVDRGRFLDQPGSSQIVQVKMRSEHRVKFGPPRLRNFVVSGRYTREQCRGRELQLAARGSPRLIANEG